MITVKRFLGDTEREFALTDAVIVELERLRGVGIGVLYQRAVAMQFSLEDIGQTIRLALIGAGANPADAARLTETWVTNRPLAETYPLAMDLLDARWNGADTTQETPE